MYPPDFRLRNEIGCSRQVPGCNHGTAADVLLERESLGKTKNYVGEGLDLCEYLTRRFVCQMLRMLTAQQLSESRAILTMLNLEFH